jgi:hypothetical protein
MQRRLLRSRVAQIWLAAQWVRSRIHHVRESVADTRSVLLERSAPTTFFMSPILTSQCGTPCSPVDVALELLAG